MCGSNLQNQRGFSLIELMVAMVVSLAIGIAAAGSGQFFAASQRQAVGSGTAQGNSATAGAALKYEIELTGLGLYLNGAFMCPSFNLSPASTAVLAGNTQLPIQIAQDVTGSSTIDVLHASSLLSGSPTLLQGALATTQSALVELSGYLPVNVGQTVMLAPPSGSTLPCTVRTITAVTAATALNGIQLTFGNAAQFNQVTYTNQAYPAGTALALLDQLSWTRFRIDANSNLLMERPLDGTSAILARGVVGFHAQYGITDGVTTSLQAWVDDAGASALLPTGISAVRIGMVLRSPQMEKPNAAGVCDASASQPALLDTPLALAGSWQCYRYRSTVVVVPLRNAQMGGAA